jgi:hypothetical protein
MANVLSKSNIANSNTIEAWQVSQSVDAFTGISDYDITISGSLIVTGSTNLSGSVDITGGDLTVRGFANATASWADNIVNIPTSINRYILPLGSIPTLFNTQMIAGAGLIASGTSISTIDITPVDFTGKVLGSDVFITVGISSSYSTSSMSYYPKADSLGPNLVTFTTTAASPFDVPFFFTIVYKS